MLNDAVLAAMNKSVLCWLAPVDADGSANVSPKAPSYRLYPETSETQQVESAMPSYGVQPAVI
ncbi:pyridoxamine 5'-phosphate oxidase family protein [Paraburkholderia sp. J94]|uniref:pyridoxamine 5'-phosphate oxidase family protein n=1 Tax=Paraburkholderia sp. J94 TaxID=2805441 RepID=UPI002AB01565|nr:pyridoxamine 5'-phosphate oxidase family protein [Paraburkholderia sp. J94]